MLVNHDKNLSDEAQCRLDLTLSYKLAAYFKWDDLIYTHFSSRIPSDRDHYLINPFGLLFHEITPESLLKVDLDGNIVGENKYNYNPAGENVHGTIYRARQDINSIVHVHTLNGMALSALKEGLLPICQQSCHFYGRIAYHKYYGIATDKDEQESLLEDLGDKSAMILHNHGLLTTGRDIQEAICEMNTLEKAAAVQVMAASSGRELILPDNDVCEKVIAQTKKSTDIKNYKIEWNAMVRLLSKDSPSESIYFKKDNLFGFYFGDDNATLQAYDERRIFQEQIIS